MIREHEEAKIQIKGSPVGGRLQSRFAIGVLGELKHVIQEQEGGQPSLDTTAAHNQSLNESTLQVPKAT